MKDMNRARASKEGVGEAHDGRTPASNAYSFFQPINALFLVAGAAYLAVFAYSSWGASILAPYSDMIDLIDDYFRAVDLGRPFEYLLDPHNLHRIPWLRGLIALDIGVFRGTGLPSVVVAAICLAGTACMLMLEVRRVAGALAFPLLTLTAMLVLLTANAAGVSVPANSPHLHTTFFAVLSLVAAASGGEQSGSWPRWAAAITCATLASFSLATGLVLWPILVLMAWRSQTSWWATVSLAAAAGAFCLAYLAGQSVSAPLQQGLDPKGLLKAAEYFLAYLGLPWVRGSRLFGEILGAGILVASLFALIRFGFAKVDRTQRLALGMILFSLGGAALAAIGRRDIAQEVDVPVRYAILLAPLHVGLLLLAASAIVRAWKSKPRFVSAGLMAALALMMAQQVVVGVVVVRAAERARQTIALYHQGGRTPEMLQWVYPDLAIAETVYAEMRRRGVFLQWIGGSANSARLEPVANSTSPRTTNPPSNTNGPSVSPDLSKHFGEASWP
ncbi:MAG: hypothetical protein ABL956_04495 [Hyphomonadaceae bacterium]